MTNDPGIASNVSCVFPFTYKGVTYTGCGPWPWSLASTGTYENWCATTVDEYGNVIISKDGKFDGGYCGDDCPLQGIDYDY